MAHLLLIPVKTQTESNSYGMPFARANRAKNQRLATWAVMNSDRLRLMDLRGWPSWSITLTRLSPGTLDKEDNLPSAMKHVRDEIAKELRVGRFVTFKKGPKKGKTEFREEDSDPRFRWHYSQRRTQDYGVEVRFEMGAPRTLVEVSATPRAEDL